MHRHISRSVYLQPEQNDALRELSDRTRVPASALIREAINRLLQRDRDGLPLFEERS